MSFNSIYRFVQPQPADDSTGERTLLSAHERRRPSVRLAYWLLFAVVLLASLATLVPLYWMFSGALKTTPELVQVPPVLWPPTPQWQNYALAWNRLRYSLYFYNTLLLALGTWMFQLAIATTAAYALSKLKPAFSHTLLLLFLATLMVPSSAYLIPQYLTVVQVPLFSVQLLDTWWAVWLPQAANPLYIVVLKRFFDDIPAELTEAARIDGASAWWILIRIVLPLARPALAVISIFSLIGSWQDFFWPFLVLTNPHTQPIMVALYRLSQRAEEPLSLIVAALAIASIPPIVICLLLQRFMLRGMSLTDMRG
jgi:multiple sugar transport system permease protein